MHWNGFGWPPISGPAPPQHDTTHFLIDLNRAIAKLAHSSGRIEGELAHVRERLDEGDGNFREIRSDLAQIKGELATVKADREHSRTQPSRLESFKTLAETLAPMVKEAWPFLAVAGAAGARFLGVDLGSTFGP